MRDFGIEDFIILDRHGVGASFQRWPREMRLMSACSYQIGASLSIFGSAGHPALFEEVAPWRRGGGFDDPWPRKVKALD